MTSEPIIELLKYCLLQGDAPSDIEKLIQETHRALSSEETMPSILFIDAINQVSQSFTFSSQI